jgi:hypothetical protein
MRLFITIVTLIFLVPFPTCAENMALSDFVGRWQGMSRDVAGRHESDFRDNGYIIERSTFFQDKENKKPQIAIDILLYKLIGTTAKTIDILVMRDIMNTPRTYVYRLHKGDKSRWLGPNGIGIKVYTCALGASEFLSTTRYSIDFLEKRDTCNFESHDYSTYSRKK